MLNGIKTGDPRGFNKGRSLKFSIGSWVRQTPEECQRTYRPKHHGNNNKHEDNSPKTLNDKKKCMSTFYSKTVLPLNKYKPNFYIGKRNVEKEKGSKGKNR